MNIVDLPYQANSEALFLKLSHLAHCVWLDSGKPHSSSGRYDILSALPSEILSTDHQNFSAQINAKLAEHSLSQHATLPFSGGWIGQINYDFKHRDFGLSTATNVWFGWYDWAIIVDHQLQTTVLLTLPSSSKATQTQVRIALDSNSIEPEFHCSKFIADENKDHYLQSIARIHEYLLAGDCYQVNYTQRFSAEFSGAAAGAYLKLRRTVPSPFCAFIDLGERTILSVSPERFIQLQQRHALTQPIKGTCRRGTNSEEDEQAKIELQNSEKNRAENVMIVDLLRNDFGQLCMTGSVKVPKLFEIESFANVHHLVSTITGELPPEISHSEFLLSCFPGGSITGAPKKRAMEIIEELEQHPRQSYCGAIGYFSCNGNSDFNIAIRTMEQTQGVIQAWAGGGIVIDSEPESEYEECFAKIERLMKALEKD